MNVWWDWHSVHNADSHVHSAVSSLCNATVVQHYRQMHTYICLKKIWCSCYSFSFSFNILSSCVLPCNRIFDDFIVNKVNVDLSIYWCNYSHLILMQWKYRHLFLLQITHIHVSSAAACLSRNCFQFQCCDNPQTSLWTVCNETALYWENSP